MESLPSHRKFLTTLIEALSQDPASQIPAAPPSSLLVPTASSPLETVTANQRRLLLTLHVLFPNLLLPALDLLDRGLVAQLKLSSEANVGAASASQTAVIRSRTFLVKSLATTLSRRPRDLLSSSSQRYIVLLDSWNCSCANFTFESFPSSVATALPPPPHGAAHPSEQQQEDANRSFGALSLDGMTFTADVPCCKHLLACLLVDRWSAVLGRYAEEKLVTREEMAGIIMDV